jgi:NAD(P)H-flavin reductase
MSIDVIRPPQQLAADRIQPMRPEFYRVGAVKQETVDAFTMTLVPDGAHSWEGFAPGQFNMLYLMGVGEVAISISGDPEAADVLVHTVRAVGTVTKGMAKVRRGGVIGVRGPFGTQWPVEEAIGRDVVIVAGGIGLAPLRPAIYHVLAHRGDYGRVVLLYGARTPADILYPSELESWRGRFDVEVGVTVDAAAGDWHGDVGVVTTLMARAKFAADDAVAMICGPEIMMRFAAMELERLGMSDSNIYISMERNMHCGVGYCGHCQYGPTFICKDGPVFRYDHLAPLLAIREI